MSPSPSLEQTYRVVLGETRTVHITLVGVGGTGSHLAFALGRLAYHARRQGIQVNLTLVDPDRVEEKNVGRQLFCPAELGHPKAICLTTRLNAALGLDVTARCERFEAAMLHWYAGGRHDLHLLIGAVDNHSARRELAQAVAAAGGLLWAIDTGNARSNGQVLIGNLANPRQIRFDELGLCTGLPSPYLQEPDLLEPAAEGTALSCGELVFQEEQSLMINQAVAAVAAQYAYAAVIQRELRTFATYLNLEPPVASSRLITRANLTALTG